MNSADHAMDSELARIWKDIDGDPSVNAVILTGAGKVFSAGGDFEMIKGLVNDPEIRLQGWREARDIVYNLINCSKPVVTAMRDVAVGAGLVCGSARRYFYRFQRLRDCGRPHPIGRRRR